MESWVKITSLLCIYGIFKEIRPSEPFLTEYLEGPWINLTKSQVNHEVYPVWTYSYLPFLILVLLTVDFVRYKPVLIIEGMAYIITWTLLLWSKGLFAMQMMQMAYGVATSTEVAYFTYIYSLVSESEFQRVTSYARAALLFGRFISGILSQILISTKTLDFRSLNYVSFTSVIISFLISIILPRPPQSVYSRDGNNSDQKFKDKALLYTGSSASHASQCEKCSCINVRKTFSFMVKELKRCYSDRNLLLWSFWWAFATCGNIQVGNYIQPLWETIAPWNDSTNNNGTSGQLYNGAVEATHTLLSSGAAVVLGSYQIRWLQLANIILGLLTIIESGLLIVVAWTSNIWTAYISYVAFRMTYQMMITIVSFQVAKNLTADTHGLIFGTNTFAAILLQTVITLAFVDKNGLHLEPRQQFTMYSIYFGILAAVFIVLAAIKRYQYCKKIRKTSSLLQLQEEMENKT